MTDEALIAPPLRAAVDDLLAHVERDPTQIPASAIAALHGTAHNLTIDRRSRTPVVYVTPRTDAVLKLLSPREREVALLTAGGFSNQQIARALSISVHTVKDHVHAILVKTGLESRAQLIAAWYGGLRATYHDGEEGITHRSPSEG